MDLRKNVGESPENIDQARKSNNQEKNVAIHGQNESFNGIKRLLKHQNHYQHPRMESSKVVDKDTTWPVRVEKSRKNSNVRNAKFCVTPITMKRSKSPS